MLTYEFFAFFHIVYSFLPGIVVKRGCMFITENSLKSEYVSVASGKAKTFGGSQSFFLERKGLINSFKNKGGCGIVAICDFVSYLSGNKAFSSSNDYIKYFNSIARSILWIPTPLGLTFIHQLIGLKHMLIKNNIHKVLYWGFSRRKLYIRINRMLSNDIPVILCIPRLIGPRQKERSLPFYRLFDNDSFREVTKVNGHFVTVTGIVSDGDNKYLEISSWGQKYYISFDEYMAFTKKTPMSLLGYNMCVK